MFYKSYCDCDIFGDTGNAIETGIILLTDQVAAVVFCEINKGLCHFSKHESNFLLPRSIGLYLVL